MTEVGPPYDFPEAMAILGSNEINRPIPWDSLTQSQKDFQTTKMAIHAAMIDYMDREIGRLVSYIKEQNELDNTLIFFLSDNGASAEIMVRGDGHDSEAPLGSADSHLCLGPGWSTAANTPFRYHKTWTYEGGTASPLIVFWPKGIRGRGEIRDQVSHVIDLWPTILEVAGVNYQTPASPNYQRPGKSLTQQFASSATEPRTLWWLHEGNRALRHGDWKINMEKSTGEWELYHLKTDRTEMSDVAKDHPGILSDLSNRWNRSINSKSFLQKIRSKTPVAVNVSFFGFFKTKPPAPNRVRIHVTKATQPRHFLGYAHLPDHNSKYYSFGRQYFQDGTKVYFDVRFQYLH